jgi:hypothetical protein
MAVGIIKQSNEVLENNKNHDSYALDCSTLPELVGYKERFEDFEKKLRKRKISRNPTFDEMRKHLAESGHPIGIKAFQKLHSQLVKSALAKERKRYTLFRVSQKWDYVELVAVELSKTQPHGRPPTREQIREEVRKRYGIEVNINPLIARINKARRSKLLSKLNISNAPVELDRLKVLEAYKELSIKNGRSPQLGDIRLALIRQDPDRKFSRNAITQAITELRNAGHDLTLRGREELSDERFIEIFKHTATHLNGRVSNGDLRAAINFYEPNVQLARSAINYRLKSIKNPDCFLTGREMRAHIHPRQFFETTVAPPLGVAGDIFIIKRSDDNTLATQNVYRAGDLRAAGTNLVKFYINEESKESQLLGHFRHAYFVGESTGYLPSLSAVCNAKDEAKRDILDKERLRAIFILIRDSFIPEFNLTVATKNALCELCTGLCFLPGRDQEMGDPRFYLRPLLVKPNVSTQMNKQSLGREVSIMELLDRVVKAVCHVRL